MRPGLSGVALLVAAGACSISVPTIDYTGLSCSASDPCGMNFSCGPKGTCVAASGGGGSAIGSTGRASGGTSTGSNGTSNGTGSTSGSSSGTSSGGSGTSTGAGSTGGSTGAPTQGLATLALGRAHGCEIAAQGAIDCWGNNDVGQLGNGTLQPSWLPVQVSSFMSGAIAIAVGGDQSCALYGTSGAVICWGDESEGVGTDNLGYATTPAYVSGLNSGATALAVGYSHACALANGAGGKVECWGNNDDGQLGNGSYTSSTGPVTVSTFASGASAVAAGDYHSCAIRTGSVSCWGNNLSGQLGDGLSGNPSNVAAAVVGLTSAIAIAAGSNHTCALLDGGYVDCWGANDSDQLGTQFAASGSASPVPVTGVTGVISIAAGGDHSCVLTNAGAVLCWGSNTYGELGYASDGGPSSSATQVTGLSAGMVAIAAGQHSSCAQSGDGGVFCWGYGGDGELGAGSVGNAPTPQSLTASTAPPDGGSGPPAVISLVSGVGNSLALTGNGVALAWGENLDGQLGTGDLETRLLPTPITSLDAGVVSFSVGTDHGCAALTTGDVYCWGNNQSGQLGNGGTGSSLAPVPVSLPAPATAVACGGSHSCAVAGGALYCWGENPFGELGNGTTTSAGLPGLVAGLDGGVATVQANVNVTCALTFDGGLFCWGANPAGLLGNGNGQVGNANGIPSTTPAQVTGLTSSVISFAIGSNHGCAVTGTGAVECWGQNFFGELGDGNAIDQGAPFGVTGLGSGFQSVTVGDHHSCALTNAGEVLCWGRNSYGELGNGATADKNYGPVSVTGLGSGVTAIAAGDDHTCALVTGALVCWGYNGNGAMGTGTLDNATTTTPVQ